MNVVKVNDRSKAVLAGVLVLVVIAMLLAIAEGAVRLRQWVKYGSFSHLDTVYEIDPETELRVPVANDKTGNIDINSLGFRGPEITVPKGKNTLRIAFLGASTTFCAEVSRNELTWPHLVTQDLQNLYQTRNFDYVNGGVPGYTVVSSLRNLRERVAPLNPDVIVIYHATNDLSVETRAMATAQGLYRPQNDEGSWLSQHSLLWYMIEKNLRIMALQQSAESGQDRLQFNADQLGEEFRRNLSELVREATSVADVVALATFSHRIRDGQTPEEQLEAAASALYYMPYMTPAGLAKAFDRYNTIIREVAEQSGVILVGNELAIPGDTLHFNDTVHFKDAGSRAMAERVVEGLSKQLAFLPILGEVTQPR